MTPFDPSRKRNLLKTLWEKEKLLVQAISPFPTVFSTLIKDRNYHFGTFNLLSANAFHLVWSKILSCGNGFTLYKPYSNLNSFPKDKILDYLKLKTFAECNIDFYSNDRSFL